MNQYVNPYFNIKIDFPSTWSFRYWGNRTHQLKFPERYQVTYDDIPSESSSEKELVSARSSVRKNSLLGTGLHVVSLYCPNGFSLLEHRIEFETDLKREFEVFSIAGGETQSLYLEEQDDGFIWYSKFYCWKHSESIWIFCGIRSDAIEGFDEVHKIIKQLSNISAL